MIFTLFSPDKLSLSMFTDYFRTIYDNRVVIIDINGLYSKDIQQSLFDQAIEKNPNSNILIRYKAHRKSTSDTIPIGIKEKSTYVVQFDIYSTEPIVLKGSEDMFLWGVLERWKKNIEKMNMV